MLVSSFNAAKKLADRRGLVSARLIRTLEFESHEGPLPAAPMRYAQTFIIALLGSLRFFVWWHGRRLRLSDIFTVIPAVNREPGKSANDFWRPGCSGSDLSRR